MGRQRLVAIAQMKNEIDIVEPFVRHHAHYVDLIMAVDDGSVDGTYETLIALRDEGLPLVVRSQPVVGHNHAAIINQLMRDAVSDFSADWIIPIDVDEFIEPPQGQSLADVLGSFGSDLLTYGWSNFAWDRELDFLVEVNPVLRLTRRMPVRGDHKKVIVPAGLARSASGALGQGSHGFSVDGKPVVPKNLVEVSLCHFPIRSVAQCLSKTATQTLQYEAAGPRETGIGVHYREPFQRMLAGADELAAIMPSLSRHYGAYPPDATAEVLSDAPLRYVGGALRYTKRDVNFLFNIVTTAHSIAQAHGFKNQQIADFAKEIIGATPKSVGVDAIKRVLHLSAKFEEFERLVAAQKLSIESTENLLAQARGLKDALVNDNHTLSATLQELLARQNVTLAKLTEAEAKFDAITSSTSWRITTPLRFLAGRLQSTLSRKTGAVPVR